MHFIYVNNQYCRQLRMSRKELIGLDVHHFLDTKQIDFCVSDMVKRTKKQAILFQDVYDSLNTGRQPFRQIIISTPLFDKKGEIQYIFAVMRHLSQLEEEYKLANQNGIISAKTRGRHDFIENQEVIAASLAMKEILRLCRNIADTDASVLITGESGTGKDVIAHYIHNSSCRKDKPFVAINCASLPESLLEAELFGYEKGAFTGATATKPGLFEQADGGTLFLDEINSLPLNLQGKLLRSIETKVIQHIGSTKNKKVDFRLLVACNQDLFQMVQKKTFRGDLFYRINVIPLYIPPLRERKEDILPLAQRFLIHFCERNGKQKTFSSHTLKKMMEYHWPGNIRELKNFVERAVLMSVESNIEMPFIDSFKEVSPSSSNPIQQPLFSIDPAKSETFTESSYEELIKKGHTLTDYLEECELNILTWAQNKYKSTYKMADVLGTSQTSIMRRKKKYHI